MGLMIFFSRKQKSSIIFSQETHLKFEAERFIRSGWGFECFLSGAETNKNSVAVLFNNTFEHKVLKVVRDPNGCFILMDAEFIKKNIFFCKCSVDKPDFFDRLSQETEHIGNKLIIAGGDWNVLLNTNMDARNYKSVNCPRARRKIIQMMEKHELVDVWHEVYPEK